LWRRNTRIMNVPDNIPQEVMEKAECVIVFPSVLKAAFVVGASYGRGAMVCRTGEHFRGRWGAPAMFALEGGSVGFQIGGQATDLVLLVMNERGALFAHTWPFCRCFARGFHASTRRRCYPRRLRPQTDGKGDRDRGQGRSSGIRPSSDCRIRQKFAEKRVEKRIREEIAVGNTKHFGFYVPAMQSCEGDA
jgi:hypothetical protein